MKRAYGQALIELTLLISVLGMLLLWAIPELYERLQQRYAGQQILAMHMQQAPLRDYAGIEHWDIQDYEDKFELQIGEGYKLESNLSDSYAFAAGMRPLWRLLDWQSGFSLPLKTLYSASLQYVSEESEPLPWLSYLRLSDGWAPKHLHELIGRPQALTTSHYLQQIGFNHVQSLVSILPFAREFAPSQLRLGFVDIDVVPNGSVCMDAGEFC